MILPCRNTDPEIFFQPQTTRKAKLLCTRCPATDACFQAVKELEQKLGRQDGVWAGLTPAERRRKYPTLD
jgi:Transcription factor WhiB